MLVRMLLGTGQGSHDPPPMNRTQFIIAIPAMIAGFFKGVSMAWGAFRAVEAPPYTSTYRGGGTIITGKLDAGLITVTDGPKNGYAYYHDGIFEWVERSPLDLEEDYARLLELVKEGGGPTYI